MSGNNEHHNSLDHKMGEVTDRNGKLPPHNPNIISNKLPPHNPNITSSSKISNLLGAEDNETGIAEDMDAATDLEEDMHKEGVKTINKCRTKKTTIAVVREDNASNNDRITANPPNSTMECHSGMAKITREHSISNPTDPAHYPLISHSAIHTDIL